MPTPAPQREADSHRPGTPSDPAWRGPLPAPRPPAAPTRRRGLPPRGGRWALVAVAALAGVVLRGPRRAGEPAPAASPTGAAGWDVALSAGAARPVPVLVFGWGAGLHVVTVPGAGAPRPPGRRTAARLGAGGAVYVLSLGAAPLEVHARWLGEGPAQRPAQRLRFARVFQNADGSGVRTVSY